MRFPGQWINMIMQCIKIITFTLLLNGHKAASFFYLKEAQGKVTSCHPISSSFALMCSHASYSKRNITGRFRVSNMSKRVPKFLISCLLNDTILFFFSKADLNSCVRINNILFEYFCCQASLLASTKPNLLLFLALIFLTSLRKWFLTSFRSELKIALGNI